VVIDLRKPETPGGYSRTILAKLCAPSRGPFWSVQCQHSAIGPVEFLREEAELIISSHVPDGPSHRLEGMTNMDMTKGPITATTHATRRALTRGSCGSPGVSSRKERTHCPCAVALARFVTIDD